MSNPELIHQQTTYLAWEAAYLANAAFDELQKYQEVVETIGHFASLEERGIHIDGVAISNETAEAAQSRLDAARNDFTQLTAMVGSVAMMDDSPFARDSQPAELPRRSESLPAQSETPASSDEEARTEPATKRSSVVQERMMGIVEKVAAAGGVINKAGKSSAGLVLREAVGLELAQYGPASTALNEMGILHFEKNSKTARRINTIRLDMDALEKAVANGSLPESLLEEANKYIEASPGLKADAPSKAPDSSGREQEAWSDAYGDDLLQDDESTEEQKFLTDADRRHQKELAALRHRPEEVKPKNQESLLPSQDLNRKITFDIKVDGRQSYTMRMRGVSFANLDDDTKLLLTVGLMNTKFRDITDTSKQNEFILRFLNKARPAKDILTGKDLTELYEKAVKNYTVCINGQGPQLTPYGLTDIENNKRIKRLRSLRD